MSKSPTFLIWDAKSNKSDSIAIVASAQKALSTKFTKIFIYAEDSKDIPSGANELSISMNAVIRFGEFAMYDILADILLSLSKAKTFDVAVFSSELSIWFSLFQNMQPASFHIFSTTDPREDLDFTFLPMTIPTTLYKWPSLELVSEDISANSVVKDSEDAIVEEEEQVEEQSLPQIKQQKTPPKNTRRQKQEQFYEEFVSNEEEEADEVPDQSIGASPIMAQTQKINESQNLLESNKRLNFKSSTQKEIIDSPPAPLQKSSRKKAQGAAQVQAVPMQFRPLIEAMKSVGKSMVSLNDFESHLKAWAKVEGIQAPDTMTLIQDGVDQGYVIFDKTINYLRFRNRSIASAQINYE